MLFASVDAESKWNEHVEANSHDDYSKACVDYARRWAELMEERGATAENIGTIAEQASHDANTEGITRFMYGVAVSMLAQCWKLGEQLRRWHNLATQLGTEGEEANEKGTTLNPALLSIGKN